MAWLLALVGLALLALIHEGVLRLAARKWRHVIAIPIAVVAHYLAIAAVTFGFCMEYGIPNGHFATRVADVVDSMPAAGKLERGDLIRSVDGVELEYGLSDRVNRAGGRAVVIGVERAGQRVEVAVQPQFDENTRRWLLGVRPKLDTLVDRDPALAARVALLQPLYAVEAFVHDTVVALGGADEAVPGGPKRILDEIPVDVPFAMAALALMLNVAIFALLVQVVIDVIRARRR